MRMIIALVIVSVSLLMHGCQKNIERPGKDSSARVTEGLTIDQARDWFAKQDREIVNVASRQAARIRDFVPRWDYSRTGEDREYYVVEVPLQFEKSPGFSVPDDSENRGNQRVNGKTVLVILKHKSTNALRSVLMHTMETTSEPQFGYLSKGKNFSGHVIFTETDGRLIKGWIYKNGKVVAGTTNEPGEKQEGRAPLPGNCETKEIKWYERTCIFFNDNAIECSQWQYTGPTYQTYCTEEGSGGVSGPGDCDLPQPGQVLSQGSPATELISSITSNERTLPSGERIRDWHGKWSFYNGKWLMYSWKYISYDQGIQKKVNGSWVWDQVWHLSHSMSGSAPFKTTMELNQTQTTFSTNRKILWIDHNYTVKMCIECVSFRIGCATERGDSGIPVSIT